MTRRSGRRRDALNPDAFERLLALLDSDRERAGDRYERLRSKLVRYFEWNGSSMPDELADRTIDRVGQKIERGERIRVDDPSAYFYGVARNILRECWDEERRNRESLRSAPAGAVPERAPEPSTADPELRLECLERCLRRIPPESRDLILRYYEGEKGAKIANRQLLADRQGISLMTLRVRVSRLRVDVQDCVRRCVEKRASHDTNSRFSHQRLKSHDS